jgi:hypothetical protein
MSYDLEVYCVQQPEVEQGPSGPSWQVLVVDPVVVEGEDLEDSVRLAIPGLRFLVYIHIEGSAPQKAFKSANVIANRLAREYRGVVVDQQQGTVQTPRGVKRYETKMAEKDEFLPLELSWFFEGDKEFALHGATRFVDLLEQRLPEALPRRYGLFEPPQHRLDRDGIDHFKQFFVGNLRDLIVWCCSKPFDYIFVSIPDHVGPTKRGYRCCRITLSGTTKPLRIPGWPLELKKTWLEIASIVKPFYAEIRSPAQHGTKSWWWNGIPPQPPLAVLIGGPYLAHWPEFVSASQKYGPDLHYLDSRFPEQAGIDYPTPPEEIAQPPNKRVEKDNVTGEVLFEMMLNDIQYPPVWPFEGPTKTPNTVVPAGPDPRERGSGPLNSDR